jgi:sodium/proline symporter
MGDLLYIAIVFMIYMVIILLIALVGKYITKNLADYLLANRNLSGPIAALGAGASDMSSWLTMGLPGFIYINGISKIWMPIALILGAWLNWFFVAKRLRVYTEISNKSLTLPSYFHYRFEDDKKFLRIVTSVASLIFFTCYAAAGLMSGAILLEIIFNFSYLNGLLISFVVIILYTSIGGFLALNWIDFFQGTLMLLALLIVPVVTINNLGGVDALKLILNKVHPQHLNIFNNTTFLGIVSCIGWGLGYFGQPHINVRFMAIRSIKELPTARRICMTWMILSLLGAISTGLVGAAFYSKLTLAQPETVFICLSRQLFNPWITGILLSAVAASVMNAVSAQILMTTSIIVEDLLHARFKKKFDDKQYLFFSKIIMIVIAGLAALIATNRNTILYAVGFAWSGLGAAFGPTILCSLYWRRMNLPSAINGILVGMLSVIIIQPFLEGFDLLPGFVILPAFFLSTITIFITGYCTDKPSYKMLKLFDNMVIQSK